MSVTSFERLVDILQIHPLFVRCSTWANYPETRVKLMAVEFSANPGHEICRALEIEGLYPGDGGAVWAVRQLA